jgi:membrane protein implicated in regulation of membrane protease activity
LLLLGVPLSSPADWLLFGVLALAFTFGFRRRLYAALRAKQGAGLADPFTSGTALPTVLIAPGKEGPVQHNGSPWTGRNIGNLPLEPGEPAHLQGRDGLVLLLARNPIERTSA